MSSYKISSSTVTKLVKEVVEEKDEGDEEEEEEIEEENDEVAVAVGFKVKVVVTAEEIADSRLIRANSSFIAVCTADAARRVLIVSNTLSAVVTGARRGVVE